MISALLNFGLVLTAFVGGPQGRYPLVVRFADAVAAPPGVIANALFSPKQHTAHAFILAAVESLVCSFLFYALVAWVILSLVHSVKWALRKPEAPGGEGVSK